MRIKHSKRRARVAAAQERAHARQAAADRMAAALHAFHSGRLRGVSTTCHHSWCSSCDRKQCDPRYGTCTLSYESQWNPWLSDPRVYTMPTRRSVLLISDGRFKFDLNGKWLHEHRPELRVDGRSGHAFLGSVYDAYCALEAERIILNALGEHSERGVARIIAEYV